MQSMWVLRKDDILDTFVDAILDTFVDDILDTFVLPTCAGIAPIMDMVNRPITRIIRK